MDRGNSRVRICGSRRGVATTAINFDAVVPGDQMYGARYDHMEMSKEAEYDLLQAVRLVEWYTRFLCRMSVDATGVGRLVEVLEGER